MSPGPVSTTAIAMGTKNRFSGLLLGLGHTIIELPVMILIVMGMNKILNSNPAQITIGYAGGIILILMAFGMLTGIKKINEPQKNTVRDKPILAGIILLTSAPMARFMNKNVAGVNVPQDLIDEMASAQKGKAIQKGIEIAGRMIKRIHDEKMCDGVHIMAIGKEELVPDIMAAGDLI